MMLTDQQISDLQQIAKGNAGRCTTCNRIIKVYKYRVNEKMARLLRRMSAVVAGWLDKGLELKEANKVNFDDIKGEYSEKTQRSKMRLHGLIARAKDEQGKPIENTWLITKKGWDFLDGAAITEGVAVFDNQVLGHYGKPITIGQLLDDSSHQEEKITTPEAKVYSQVRKPRKNLRLRATFRLAFHPDYRFGREYDIEVDNLQTGRPVRLLGPHPVDYADIEDFRKSWKITEEKEQ